MSAPSPVFSTRHTTRGVLIECEYGGEIGAARVFSAGEQDARDRAEAQARAKYEAKNARA